MDGLKQRVVGALVIVSLAVIFLPMIFDEPHQPTKTQLIPIPVQSELPVITINSPEKPSYTLIEEPAEASDIKMTAKKVDETLSKATSSENNQAPSTSVSTIHKEEKKVVKSQPVVAASIEKKKTVFHEKALSNIWMVQLGTFGNHKNAYKLRDTLTKDGFDGHTTKLEKEGQQLIRVFSGPYADKSYADKIKKQLDKKYKLKTLVVHFK